MSAAAQTSGLNHPPTGLDRLLFVVRWLVAHGRELAATIHQRAARPDFPDFASRFGTADLALILARITRGLRRATALEAALLRRVEKHQGDAPASSSLHPSGPRSPQPSATRARCDLDADDTALLARLPSEQEIADEIRRRPIGAVIVDICHDLGICPGHLPRDFFDELRRTIDRYGGSSLVFFRNAHWRVTSWTRNGPLAHLFQPSPTPSPSPCRPRQVGGDAPAATGPPA